MLPELRDRINKNRTQEKVVSQLKILTKEDLRTLKEGENQKTKEYKALCILSNTYQSSKEIVEKID